MSPAIRFPRLCRLRLSTAVRTLLVLLLVLAATPAAPVRADTAVCGPVSGTWIPAGNNYLVTCDVTVSAGQTLTIQPGVVVKFGLGTSLIVNGTLIATGATFTSNSGTPAKGDWGRIYFTTSSQDAVFDAGGSYLSGSKIQDSLIEWGGGGTNVSGAIETNIASPYLDHNTVQYSRTSGIHALGRSTSAPIVISGSSLSYNSGEFVVGAGIFVSTGRLISNVISANGGPYAAEGAGIYATASTVTGNTVSGNTTLGSGGGIHALGSTITGNVISGNTHGGVYVTSTTLSGNTITGNSSAICGGGVHADGNSTVADNLVLTNTVTAGNYGGGICAAGGLVTGNTITGNSSLTRGGGIYADQATVTDNVISANSGGLGGGIYGYDANLSGNTLSQNNASSDGGGVYAADGTNVTGNTILNNGASQGGGIFASAGFVGVALSGNTIQDNTAASGAGIYSSGATINGNTVTSNDATGNGGGIYAEGGILTGNFLSANTLPSFGHGSGAYLDDVTAFSDNDVLTNTAPGGTAGGISIQGLSEFHYNNLYGNQPYDAEVVSAQAVSGTLNYWGLTLCTDIPARLYDSLDAPGRGLLHYAPSLYLPAPLAQLAAPTGLILTLGSGSANLSWTPLPAMPAVGCRLPGASGPDLGYRVYYDDDEACAPFDGTGLPSGASPIDAGAVSQISLPGAPLDGLVFVVTAYDYLGRESSFSNLVGSPARNSYLPLVVR
jgi:parallel beta-helix repeat protein/predicted outer membrane repeat protein